MLTVCASGCQFTTIQAAINAAATGDTIDISPGTYAESLVVGGTAATLTLRKMPGGSGDVILDDGFGTGGSVLRVFSGKNVQLIDLTLRNGQAIFGGGIENQGTLRLLRVRVVNNTAIALGGGVLNAGQLVAIESEVSDNRVVQPFGSGGPGAGIYNGSIFSTSRATMTLTNTVLQNNRSFNTSVSEGGGLFNSGDLTLLNVRVLGNRNGVGGGIANSSSGSLTGINVEVSGNIAQSSGGGIAQASTGALTLTNSTITSNQATRGGGLFLAAGKAATLLRSTVNSNTASTDGGGVFAEAGATLNRLLAAITNNTPNNCAGAVSC